MSFQGDSIFWVEVEKIVPNPYQPRREFDESKLQELSESVRMYGILQPLTVTRKEVHREDGTFYTEYELIAGERRLRASKLANLVQVPVIIREGEQSEQEKLELAIIENLQREDLNAVDRALAFKQLADQFGLSHSQIGKKVGRSRVYVSNSLRLLALPDYMLDALKKGDMSEGHARTLLMLVDRPEEMDTVFREILLKKISVREVERIARKIAVDRVRKKSLADIDPSLVEFERQFTESLGTRVQIDKTDYGGRVTIDYFSVEDLERMLAKLKDDEAALLPQATATTEVPNEADEYSEASSDLQQAVQDLQAQNTTSEPEPIVPSESMAVPQPAPVAQTHDQKSEPNSLAAQLASLTAATALAVNQTDRTEPTHAEHSGADTHSEHTDLDDAVPPPVWAEHDFMSVEPPGPSVTPAEDMDRFQEPSVTPEAVMQSEITPIDPVEDVNQFHEPVATEGEVSHPETKPEPEQATDESNLYTIRNFSV